jgi:hypothetical protein
MRQKFLIFQDGKSDNLKIREMAVIDKDLNRVASALLRKDHFTVLCEETYDKADITAAIAMGRSALMTAIRTPNLFPVAPYCAKIADSVIALYRSETDRSVELMFDDADLVAVKEEASP